MNVCITRINGTSMNDTMQYIQNQIVVDAYKLDFREMGIYRYNADDENMDYLHVRIDGIIAGISAGEIVIRQFPTGNGLKFERTLLSHIKA